MPWGGTVNGYNQYLGDPSGSGVYTGSPGMGERWQGDEVGECHRSPHAE